jgi:hypothetical protein
MVGALRAKPCGIRPSFPQEGPEPCGTCRDCLTRHIKEAAERARDSAAFLGSRIHELAEAHLLGVKLAELEGDDEAGLYVAQYLKFLHDFDVDLKRDVVAAETTVVNARDGYAGTGDIWLRLPFDGFLFEPDKASPGGSRVRTKRVDDPGERGTFLVDIKTSRKRASTQSFPENVMQLAALRFAPEMMLPDETRAPNVRVVGAATLQLRANRYSLIPLPAGPREYRLFQNVLALAEWLHHEWAGDYGNRPITPSGRFVAKRGAPKDTTPTPTTATPQED